MAAGRRSIDQAKEAAMSSQESAPETHGVAPVRQGFLKSLFKCFLGALACWLLVAYVVLPRVWRSYEKRHPALDDAPRITRTGDGIPGDPLNIALIGSEEELHLALLASKWFPADPITLASSLRIAAGTVFHRAYNTAPVSSLFLFGRKQDLAFEQPIGDDPRRRHHVRFWKSAKLDAKGNPLWIGAATLDTRVGLSHTEGEITHHISAEVDPERDKIIDDVKRAGALVRVDWIADFQQPPNGKNGGGDPWHTDGRLAIGLLSRVQLPKPTQ